MMRKFFLILTSLFLVLCLCMTACGGLTIRENGDGSYTVTPKPDEGNNTQNNQQGNNQGGTDKPTAPDYSMYSPLLQEVLNDPQWDALYSKYESGELWKESMQFDSGSNLLEAIPYSYLANKNEDIEKIKNGAARVNSELYTIESEKNIIYDKVDITYKVEDGEKYINQYLLKYRITEQELKDLKTLYSGKYYQGPVMFQCLAAKQQPEVISEFSITENAYDDLLNSLNKNSVVNENFGDKVSNYVITHYCNNADNEKDFDLRLKIISFNTYLHLPISNGYIADMSLKVDRWAKPTYSNGIIDWSSIHHKYIDEQVEASTPITYFKLYTNFKDFKDRL